MDDLRVKNFIDRAENRSFEDLCQAVVAIAEALKSAKFEPYVHVTNRPPEIKLPDIHRKETIVINFPTGLIWLLMAAPYVVIIGFALIFKFLPKLAILLQ